MPRSAALNPEQVPADSKPTLDTFTKNIGITPNMMATFAQSPIAFSAWAAMLGSLSKALDVKTRDSIGLAVSEVNGCSYCLTVHSFAADHTAKLPADEIILARKGHASDPKRVSLRGDIFQAGVTSDRSYYYGPFGMRSRCLFRTVDFARRVGGIDSIAEGHWTIDFRRSTFAHLQRNSENDESHKSGDR